MNVLMTGSTGLIGSALVPFLQEQGHSVTRLVRSQPSRAGEVLWQPQSDSFVAKLPMPPDAVVHLAGEPVAGRWTQQKKDRIRSSRVDATRVLSQALTAMPQPPRVFISASASGYYGDRGDEVLTEDSTPGVGFLADVCRDWEAATQAAEDAGIRVVHLRLGIVLSKHGGALPKMLLPFRLGLGGNLGNGRQYWRWISLDDVIGVIYHAIATGALRGAVNTVSPQPLRNSEFTQTLGRVLHRPTILPVPAFALRLLMGQMVDELLLASACIEPTRLKETKYAFQHPHLEGALRDLVS